MEARDGRRETTDAATMAAAEKFDRDANAAFWSGRYGDADLFWSWAAARFRRLGLVERAALCEQGAVEARACARDNG